MRWFLRVTIALALTIGIYVGSAVVSLDALVKAAQVGNGAEIVARTDMDRLRRSLVNQILSAYLARTGEGRPVKPLEKMIASTFGASVVDAMISQMLTAENLTNILQKGQLTANGSNQITSLAEVDTSKVFQTLGRFSVVNPVEFAIALGDDQYATAITLHFAGNGWKLSGVNLPAKVAEQLAMSLPGIPRQKG